MMAPKAPARNDGLPMQVLLREDGGNAAMPALRMTRT